MGPQRLQNKEGCRLARNHAVLLLVIAEQALPVEMFEDPRGAERVHGAKDTCVGLPQTQQPGDVLQRLSPSGVTSGDQERRGTELRIRKQRHEGLHHRGGETPVRGPLLRLGCHQDQPHTAALWP